MGQKTNLPPNWGLAVPASSLIRGAAASSFADGTQRGTLELGIQAL
jgi:hypothetical protein